MRIQQRFVPTTPNLISVINSITLGTISTAQVNTIVNLVLLRKFEDAANYIINSGLAPDKTFTEIRTTLSNTRLTNNQQLQFPVPIAAPDDVNQIIVSSQFTYNGKLCELRNRLSTNIIQIIEISGNNVILDNVGSYNASTGVVTINYFNPTNITGGVDYIKLSVVPASQSAVTPTRNERLIYDPDRSSTTAVITSANN